MASPGGCGYIVPTWQLGDELRKHQKELCAEFTSLGNDSDLHDRTPTDEGWLTLLAMRIPQYRRGPGPERLPLTTEEAAARWLYRVLSREAMKADADMADAALLSCNVLIDQTDVQTFPDNRITAEEMIRYEAALYGKHEFSCKEMKMLVRWKLDERDRVVFAKGVTEAYSRMTADRTFRHRLQREKERVAA